MIRAKTAEPIELAFKVWTRVGPMNHVLHGGATWRIRLNDACSAADVATITVAVCHYSTISYACRGRRCPVWELVLRSPSSSLPFLVLAVSSTPPPLSALSVAETTHATQLQLFTRRSSCRVK